MAKPLSEEMNEKITELHKQGLNTRQIADILDIGQATVARKLRKTGVDFKEVHKNQLMTKWKQGEELFIDEKLSVTQICNKLHIGRKEFTSWLKDRGHPIQKDGKKYHYNESFFEVIDTEEKAYWLGFLYADGCVMERINLKTQKRKGGSISVGLCQEDKKHLDKLQSSLNSNVPIRTKTSTTADKEFKSCELNLYSVKMVEDLIDKGCVPRKSLILTFPSEEVVPDELLFHFIRGYIDGDGTLCLKWSKARQKYYPSVSLLGTEDFISGLLNRTQWKKNRVRGANKGESDPCKTIEWTAREDVLKIIYSLYDEATIYLDRKYDKYKQIIAVLDGDI